jgi:lipoprotein-anchoring transpeptidase ErfK/SrfK
MRRAGFTVAAIATAGLAAVVAGPLLRHGADPAAASPAADSFTGLAVTDPGYSIGSAAPLQAVTATWAPVRRGTPVVARPRSGARQVGVLQTRTYDRTTAIVQVTGRARTQNALWVRVRFPSLPNGASGWVPRTALGGYTTVDTRLVVDRRLMRITLYRAGHAVFRAPVGVGEAATPTPAGSFFIADRLTRFSDPVYGPIAFGTSGRSPVLTDWPGGGEIGIHGTNEPGLVPGRVSHGCVRLRNADIVRLARLLPIGTPVVVE